ncbi:MAG: MarR family winged helix-turn-helix transcriptional regulator [Dermatophilaceae bacterium]|nr:MarR family transcriptional regulator [Intrasporangiaceae bacterium]
MPTQDPLDPITEAARLWGEHGWADAAPGMAAVTSLMRAQQLVLSRVEAVLKPLGVSFARYEVLMLLVFSRRGTLPMSTISARLQVHQTSVTNAVDRLEAAGLVRRLPHPSDRRTTLIEITPEGRSLADEATTLLNREVFNQPGLSARDTTTLVGILGRLRQSAGDF